MGCRNAVDTATSNHANDDATTARLSAWLNYGVDWRVTPAGANYSYSVVVMDPDDPNGTTRNADATYRPKRIQVQSTGYGPKGSIKRMEMIVQKTAFDFDPDAMLLIRGADSGAAATFDIGTSAAKFYSGHDNASAEPNIPTLGVTSLADVGVVTDAITKGATVEDEKLKQVAIADLPSWLQTADASRTFLNEMQMVARSMGRYYTSFSGNAGTIASPAYTFVNGNVTLDGGGGLLIVTGNLTLNGNAVFNGTVLVLGEGNMIRSGGGSSTILGSD